MPSESPKISASSQFRRELIQEEFRDILEKAHYEISPETDAIMVLSASPPGWDNRAPEERADFPEDVKRIEFAIEVYRRFASQKLGKPLEELTPEDLKNESLPPLVLNGATEQQPMMERIARKYGFPEDKTIFLNCGDHHIANTKTQFTKLSEHPIVGKFKNFVVISTSYHIPRTARTASVNLPEDVNFEMLGVPLEKLPFDVYKKVRGEVKRIELYSQKGDIARTPRRRGEKETYE